MNYNFEVGTHDIIKSFNCLECAKRFYNGIEDKKYLIDVWKNKLILNTYGWKNGKRLNTKI